MYQLSYAEVLEDDQTAARHVEVHALEQAIALLGKAAATSRLSREGIEALHFTRQLWMTFIQALISPENALPTELRANLISIGIWILREAEAIRLEASTNYAGIADVCAIVRDGLR